MAELNDISFKQITTWVHRFDAEVLDGLWNRKGRGRKSLLSKERMQRIKMVVLNDLPSDHGYKGIKLTGPLLAQWIEKKYRIKYQRAQIYKLLRSLEIELRISVIN